MARIRKEPNRYWSKEDKLKIINEVLLNCKSTEKVANMIFREECLEDG